MRLLLWLQAGLALEQALIAMDGIVLRGLVQRLGMVRILHGQRGIAHLSLQEGLVVLVGLGTVDLQGFFPASARRGSYRSRFQYPARTAFFISTMDRFIPAFSPWLMQGA